MMKILERAEASYGLRFGLNQVLKRLVVENSVCDGCQCQGPIRLPFCQPLEYSRGLIEKTGCGGAAREMSGCCTSDQLFNPCG